MFRRINSYKLSGLRSGNSCISHHYALLSILFKLKCYDLDGDALYNILINYLQNRKLRLIFNEQSSLWFVVNVGEP